MTTATTEKQTGAFEGDQRITHSEMQTAKGCLRKHYLAYALGIRAETDAVALRIGSAFHQFVDLLAQGVGTQEAMQRATASYDDAIRDASDDRKLELGYEKYKCLALMAGYAWRWQEQNDELKFEQTEQVFDVPIINPDTGRPSRTHRFAGKIDKIIVLPDGRRAIMEHKTTSMDISLESDYWRRLRIDSQISNYYIACDQLGIQIDTIIYDVVRKPLHRPREVPVLDENGLKIVLDQDGNRVKNKNGEWRQTASREAGYAVQTRPETPREYGERILNDMTETPDNYFARKEVARTEADIVEAQYELWQMSHILHDCKRHGRWPRNTASCIGFGRCQYFDICTSGADLNAGLPPGYRYAEDKHEELASE